MSGRGGYLDPGCMEWWWTKKHQCKCKMMLGKKLALGVPIRRSLSEEIEDASLLDILTSVFICRNSLDMKIWTPCISSKISPKYFLFFFYNRISSKSFWKFLIPCRAIFFSTVQVWTFSWTQLIASFEPSKVHTQISDYPRYNILHIRVNCY